MRITFKTDTTEPVEHQSPSLAAIKYLVCMFITSLVLVGTLHYHDAGTPIRAFFYLFIYLLIYLFTYLII